MNRTEYVERLMKIGILECCAERTVDAFLDRESDARSHSLLSKVVSRDKSTQARMITDVKEKHEMYKK